MRPILIATTFGLIAFVISTLDAPHRPSEELYAAAQTALTEGRPAEAFALFDEAAAAGHVLALARVAKVREAGYLRSPRYRGQPAVDYAVPSLPGQVAWMRWRSQRALAHAADAGDPEALLAVATDLLGSVYWIEGQPRTRVGEADLDSVASIYQQIRGEDLPQMPLGVLALGLGDDVAYHRHLDRAAASGEASACTFKLWFSGDRHDTSTAVGFARFIDAAVEACPFVPNGPDPAADDLRRLAAEIDAGNREARLFLDSLRAEGVFDRHPRLAAIASGEQAGSASAP